MSILRASLSVALCVSLAQPTVALAAPPPPPPPPSGSAAAAAQPEQPPDPSTVSAEERINWAKKLFKEATEAHDREDFYNSVIKFEQAYSFAPDKHIFAYNIGQDAWELRDCARVKQYLELFLVKENAKMDLRKKAQEILTKAENNPECVTGGPAQTSQPTNTTNNNSTSSRPASDEEDPLALKKKNNSGGGDSTDDEPKKRGTSGLFLGGVVLMVLGIGAVGGGVGTLAIASGKKGAIEDAAAPGTIVTSFSQGQYNDDVDGDFKSLKTLNLVTPILLAAGGAMLVGGIAMIVVDRGNKKKGKGAYANVRPGLAGMGAAPLPGGGGAASMSFRF